MLSGDESLRIKKGPSSTIRERTRLDQASSCKTSSMQVMSVNDYQSETTEGLRQTSRSQIFQCYFTSRKDLVSACENFDFSIFQVRRKLLTKIYIGSKERLAEFQCFPKVLSVAVNPPR